MRELAGFLALLVLLLACLAFVVIDGVHSRNARLKTLEELRLIAEAQERASQAQGGKPESYTLPPTHREAVHLLGNAVCPPVARDLITAVIAQA